MSEIDEMRIELEQIGGDIPAQIKTGIPANIKSQNIRGIHQRSNEVSLQIVDFLESLSEQENLIQGESDPNVEWPSGYFAPGYFYLRWHTTEISRVPIAFYLYTGIPGLDWWKVKDFESNEKIYGLVADPNAFPILNGVDSKIGDYYIETSTGTEEGNVLSVWFYLGLHVGNGWLKLEDKTISAVLFSNQNLTTAQIRQTKKNLGWIEINGNLFELKKKPTNNIASKIPEVGDRAVNGWIDNERYGERLIFKGGDPTLLENWHVSQES